ncbi:CDP-diacylglycerol--serine O-phosphatidyltransferase (EC 2.7.8.8) [Pseudomonas sp. FEN]|nr:CDP-diacylglycerol--serine O-phosphatidyltransferase (EC 2.7.8.8) [Pseudomonas sp. FEN]
MTERPEEPGQGSDAESLLPIDEHVEEGHDANGQKVRHRGIYLLPNLFTTANLFAGFYAIISAMSAQSAASAGDPAGASKYFAFSAIAIFVAMVLDGLDGRVARMTNTQSAFGAEYDSLSDMVAFGVAPALLAFGWALGDMGKVGWMGGLHLCGRRGVAPGAFQYPGRYRRQAPISSAWPVRRRPAWWRVRCGRSATTGSRVRRCRSW